VQRANTGAGQVGDTGEVEGQGSAPARDALRKVAANRSVVLMSTAPRTVTRTGGPSVVRVS
jgi:hypothetical protein